MYSWSGEFFPGGEVAGRARASADAACGQESYGGRGCDLLPLEPTPLVVDAVDVDARLVPVEDAWRVSARYRLRNPTQGEVHARVALVEEAPPPALDPTPAAGRFRDVVVAARGEALEPIPGDAEPGWGDAVQDVCVYGLTVAPGEAIEVDVTYELDASRGVDFTALRFLARTAGLWGSRAAPARYRITLPRPPAYLAVTEGFELLSWTDERGENGTRSVATFECAAWAGTDDVLFVTPGASLSAAPPPAAELAADLTDGQLRAELGAYTDEELAACADRLAAVYGAGAGDVPEPPYPGLRVHRHPPNPALDESWYTEGERRWLDAVRAEQEWRKELQSP